MGPYIVTKDELPAPENVNIVTKVNNEIRQDGNTGEMILKIDELIEKISKYVLYIQAISLQLVHLLVWVLVYNHHNFTTR